ncbi:MAG: hypothetical protein JNK84_01535 [Phreatobacter sp.]|uniref:hypothetical protein n=1 Tax=Phreatobacter sp. TaxID=1966341 RepID=UPI001A516E41|nr:hypothetical protein [Phreatobacter sp.]MBL8567745.1 hypothetical protein [Phreatobacter sp.]
MSTVARLFFGFVVGALAVLLVHQLTIWGLSRVGVTAVSLFPMRANLPWAISATAQQAVIGGLWGLLYILIWDRWGRYGVVRSALFGAGFGLIGPAMVLWIVWPLIWGTPLFGGGSMGRIAVVALTAVVFGIGLAWLVQVINGFMRHASR